MWSWFDKRKVSRQSVFPTCSQLLRPAVFYTGKPRWLPPHPCDICGERLTLEFPQYGIPLWSSHRDCRCTAETNHSPKKNQLKRARRVLCGRSDSQFASQFLYTVVNKDTVFTLCPWRLRHNVVLCQDDQQAYTDRSELLTLDLPTIRWACFRRYHTA